MSGAHSSSLVPSAPSPAGGAMDRTVLTVAAAVGGLLVVAALILGLSPISAAGVDCGSAFSPRGEGELGNMFLDDTAGRAAACEESRSGRQAWAMMLGGVGAVALLGSGWVYQRD